VSNFFLVFVMRLANIWLDFVVLLIVSSEVWSNFVPC